MSLSRLNKTSSRKLNVELMIELVKICDWLQTNKLSLNILKTENMIIGTEQMLIQTGSILKIKIGSFYLILKGLSKQSPWD